MLNIIGIILAQKPKTSWHNLGTDISLKNKKLSNND